MNPERIGKVFVVSYLFSLVVAILSVSGCSNPVAHIPEFPTTDLPRARPTFGLSANSPYRMVPNDVVSVRFTYHPEQDPKAPIPIRPDGNIILDAIGSIQASGLTPEQLAKVIAEKSSSRLKDPQVVVTVVQFAPRKVYVGGEVKSPGVVVIDREGMTPLQAIFDRGGFTTIAQVDSVILIREAGSENPKIGRLNLNQSMEHAAPEQVTLLPNDVLYVPMSGIGRADLWVRQHLRDIIPWEIIQPPGITSFMFR